MTQSVRLVIFDLDGTLIDAYIPVVNSIQFALSSMGFKVPNFQIIKRSVGWGDRHLIEGFVGKENSERVLKVYRRHHMESLKCGVKFLPGAKSILDLITKQNIQMAIASNRPMKFSLSILKTLKMRHYFDYVLCADKAPRPKPYPDMLNMVVQKLNRRKSEALYVGDMSIDIQTGKRAGVRTVGVTTGSCRRDELMALKPFRVINRISQLKKIITELNKERKNP